MNTLDIKDEDVRKAIIELDAAGYKDPFSQMFALQKKWLEKRHLMQLGSAMNLMNKRSQADMRTVVFFMVEELFEAMNCLKMRPWTLTDYPVDEAKFREEVADFWGLCMQFFVLAGMSPEQLRDAYVKKSLVNDFRYETNY